MRRINLHWLIRMFTVIAALGITSQSLAQQKPYCIDILNNMHDWHTIVSLGGGMGISNHNGSSQTFPSINPDSDEFYTYSANHSTHTMGIVDGFIGREWQCNPCWALQIGLDYNQLSQFHAKGSFLQGVDNQSADQYTYQYSIFTQQLLAMSKLFYCFRGAIHPYLLLGLGVAFNDAFDYSTNVPPFLTFTRQYQNKSQSVFSYAVGLGVDVEIMKQVRLGAGYRFADLGKVELGSAMIDMTSVSGTLSQTHLYTNELIAQITWVI